MKKLNAFSMTMLMMFAGWVNREQNALIDYLLEANSILKAKLEKDGKRIRYTDRERARLARKGKKIRYSVLARTKAFLSPDTILRWHNKYIAKKYTAKNKRNNPSKAKASRKRLVDLVCKLAEENPLWGAGRIRGNLKHLGINRTKSSIAKIMKDFGFNPKPRGDITERNTTWLNFVRTHLHLMVNADFFTKEVWTSKGLVRYLVFFVIDCATKKVKVVHISNDFYGEKMVRLALSMTDQFDGVLKDKKHFVCDKDVLYTKKFCSILEDSGVKVHKVTHPNQNAYAERFVKTIKKECLNNIICFGEKMLRNAVSEYVEYYNTERPHQGIDNDLISPENNKFNSQLEATKNLKPAPDDCKWAIPSEPIEKSVRLGGLLNFYYRKVG